MVVDFRRQSASALRFRSEPMTEPTAEGAGTSASGSESPIPEELLEILVCPLGKKPLRLEGDTLVCTNCGTRFKIEDGIPNMLMDDATLPEGITDLKQLACHPEAGGE